jgi:methyl-accepting chemotaxis protein
VIKQCFLFQKFGFIVDTYKIVKKYRANMSSLTLLVNKLSLGIKFVLLSVVFVLPLLFITGQMVIAKNTEIASIRLNLEGTDGAKQILLSYQTLSQLMIQQAQIDGGVELSYEKQLETAERLNRQFAAARKRMKDSNNPSLKDLQITLQNNQQDSISIDALAETLLSVLKSLSVTYKIKLVSQLDSSLLADIWISDFTQLYNDYLLTARWSSQIAAAQAFTPDSYVQLNTAHKKLSLSIRKIAELKTQLLKTKDHSNITSQLTAIVDQLQNYLTSIKTDIIEADHLELSYTELESKHSFLTDLIYDNWLALHNQYEAKQKRRLDSEKKYRLIYVFIVSLVLLVAIFFVLTIYRSVNSSVRQLMIAMDKVSSGDLTTRANVEDEGEFGAIAGNFNHMVHENQWAIKELIEATSNVNAAVHKLLEATDTAKSAVFAQQKETHQVASAISEMAATSTEVASNAEEGSAATKRAEQSVEEGQTIIGDTIHAIHAISDEVENTQRNLTQLAEDSLAIGQVLSVIKSIAEQTNLLALNAAIEAARAGEQGRGFAVVADEVRNLASKTQASTEEIHAIIDRVQQGSIKSVKAMNQCIDMAGKGVEQAKVAGDKLDDITQAVGKIVDMNAQIASAVEQQSIVAEEIEKNTANISSSADSAMQGAESALNISSDLKKVVGSLNEIAKKFSV